MSRDGAGTYNLPPGNPVVTETVISSTTHNTTMADLATALTQSISKDGQTTYTANQSMGGFKHTQVADATARNQYATAAQVQDGTLTLIGSVSGTDTITGTISPAISAYANGVFLTLLPMSNNTGPVTLALNGLGAKPVLKFNSVPLVAGDLLVGVPATIVYNGTNFYLENPQVAATDVARLSQQNNFTSNNTFSVAGTGAAPTLNLSSAFPLLGMNNTVAPANNRSWLQYIDTTGAWHLRADLDDHSAAGYAIVCRRNAQNVTSLEFTATSITVNGVNVTDNARLSQANIFLAPQTVGNGSSTISLAVKSNATAVGSEIFVIDNSIAGSHTARMIDFRRNSASVGAIDLDNNGLNFTASFRVGGANVRDASALFNTGQLADVRVAQSNVTQHQAALAINTNQIAADISPISGSVAVNTTHQGNILVVDNASTVTLTVGNNALGGNGRAAIYVRRNTGAVTFSASGVTIRSPGGGTSISIQHGKVALIQISSTEFELAGNV